MLTLVRHNGRCNNGHSLASVAIVQDTNAVDMLTLVRHSGRCYSGHSLARVAIVLNKRFIALKNWTAF